MVGFLAIFANFIGGYIADFVGNRPLVVSFFMFEFCAVLFLLLRYLQHMSSVCLSTHVCFRLLSLFQFYAVSIP